MLETFSQRAKEYKKAAALYIVIGAGGAMSGCTTNPYTGEQEISKTAISAGIGSVLGAFIDKDKRARGALIGGILGGGAGYYFDQQAAELRKELQGTGVSVAQQEDGSIILNMPSHITFATGSADIQPEFFDVLNSVATVLNEYDNTDVTVLGFTDSSGPDSFNQDLSERRAYSVKKYLEAQDISQARLYSAGYGEQYANQQKVDPQDRRVEVKILAPGK